MRRSLALRRSAAALALPLLALTACADDSNSGDGQSAASESTPGDDSSEASDEAEGREAGSDAKDAPSEGEKSENDDAATARSVSPLMKLDLKKGDAVGGKKFAAVAKWALDNATTAKIDLKATAQGGVSGSGSIDHTTSPLSLQLAIDAAGTKGEVRLVDGAIFMSTGQMGGDKFLKLDVSDGAGPGFDLSELDPSRSLENGVGKMKFTYRGTETINGARTQRFSADDVDIWFEERGFISRIKRDAGAQGVTTATYSDWGAAVDISAPPADQVQEMPSLPQAPPRA